MQTPHIKQFCNYMRDNYGDVSTNECGPYKALDVFGIYLNFCNLNKLIPLRSEHLEKELFHRGVFEWPVGGTFGDCEFYF